MRKRTNRPHTAEELAECARKQRERLFQDSARRRSN